MNNNSSPIQELVDAIDHLVADLLKYKESNSIDTTVTTPSNTLTQPTLLSDSKEGEKDGNTTTTDDVKMTDIETPVYSKTFQSLPSSSSSSTTTPTISSSTSQPTGVVTETIPEPSNLTSIEKEKVVETVTETNAEQKVTDTIPITAPTTLTLSNGTKVDIKKVEKIKEYDWLGSFEKVIELINYLSSPRLEHVWFRDSIISSEEQATLIEKLWQVPFLLEPYVSQSYLVYGGSNELVSKILRSVNTFKGDKSKFIQMMAPHWRLLYQLGATVKRLNEVLLIELSEISTQGREIADQHLIMGLKNVDELIRRVDSGEKYELLGLQSLYAMLSPYSDESRPRSMANQASQVAKVFEKDSFLNRMAQHMNTPVSGLLHENPIKSAASTLLSIVFYLSPRRKREGLEWLTHDMVRIFLEQARTHDVSVLMDTLFILCMVLERKDYRSFLLENGVVELILEIGSRPMMDINGKPRSYTEYLTGMIRLLSDKPFPQWEQISPLMPLLARMITELDGIEELFDVCSSVANITQNNGFNIAEFHNLMFLPQLLRHLGHRSIRVCRPALAAIGNIISNDDAIAQTVFCDELFQRLKEFTKSSDKNSILKETLWIISNIVADSRQQIQMCIDNGLLLTSFERFINQPPPPPEKPVKPKQKKIKPHLSTLKCKHGEEMMWIIHNIFTTASLEQIVYCIDHGCLDVFLRIVSLIKEDDKIRSRWISALRLVMSTLYCKMHLIELGVLQIIHDFKQIYTKIENDPLDIDVSTLVSIEDDFQNLIDWSSSTGGVI